MATFSFRNKTLLLLFATTLALSAASPAAPRRVQAPRAASLAPLSLLDRAWSALQSLWSETGCMLDPSGRCLTGAPQAPQPAPHLDEGCMLDPSGRCRS